MGKGHSDQHTAMHVHVSHCISVHVHVIVEHLIA